MSVLEKHWIDLGDHPEWLTNPPPPEKPRQHKRPALVPVTACAPTCYFCFEQVRHREPAFILLASEHTTPSIEVQTKSGARLVRGDWSHSAEWQFDADYRPVAVLAHQRCITGAIDMVAYGIPLHRVHEKDWLPHLKRKHWWWNEIEDVLALARRLVPKGKPAGRAA